MNKKETKKELTQEEKDVKRLVKPHKKKSRKVTDKDIDRAVEESTVLYRLCFIPLGNYGGAYAMHHSQIDKKDPLDLFVTADRKIVMNIKINKHSNYEVDSREGCQSYPELPMKMVKRWQKCEIEYVSFAFDPEDKDKYKISEPVFESLSGFDAFVFQHEYDHGQGKFIY